MLNTKIRLIACYIFILLLALSGYHIWHFQEYWKLYFKVKKIAITQHNEIAFQNTSLSGENVTIINNESMKLPLFADWQCEMDSVPGIDDGTDESLKYFHAAYYNCKKFHERPLFLSIKWFDKQLDADISIAHTCSGKLQMLHKGNPFTNEGRRLLAIMAFDNNLFSGYKIDIYNLDKATILLGNRKKYSNKLHKEIDVTTGTICMNKIENASIEFSMYDSPHSGELTNLILEANK